MTVNTDTNPPPISIGLDTCDAKQIDLRPQTDLGQGETMHINQNDSNEMEPLSAPIQTKQTPLHQQQTSATPLDSAAQTPGDYYTGSDSTDTDEGKPDHVPLVHRQTKCSQTSAEDRNMRIRRSDDKIWLILGAEHCWWMEVFRNKGITATVATRQLYRVIKHLTSILESSGAHKLFDHPVLYDIFVNCNWVDTRWQ
jgi:hypothetical protein